MKVLIIGANGFTGRRLLQDLSSRKDYIVTGASLHNDIQPGKNYSFIRADITNEEEVRLLFEITQPDIVINTSALSVPDYCETHRDEAYLINVLAVRQLAEHSTHYRSRFIHLSTDFVFDGQTDKLYTEQDIPNPVNYYGVTKWEGENEVARICDNYAIVRVVVVYGKALPGQHGNILQLVANKLRNKESIRIVSDQWRTPTYVGDISRGIEALIETPLNGIYHICGNECLSIVEIAYRVADYLQLDRSLIQPVRTKEMKEVTPRPRFSGLSIEKAMRNLNYSPISLEEGMKAMFNASTATS